VGKYLDPEYRTLGKHALWRQEGRTGAYLKVNGEMYRDKGNPNLPRHALWRPGMDWDAIGSLDPHIKHPAAEGASDPQARLSDMDAMGVDQALLYPTWFAEGFFLVRDPDVAYALARAYNDWIGDFCKAAPERLFAAAILPLQNMDFALVACKLPSMTDRVQIIGPVLPLHTGTESLQTRRWSKGDSNSPSHPERRRSKGRHIMGPAHRSRVSESRPPEKRHTFLKIAGRTVGSAGGNIVVLPMRFVQDRH
jgi:hypothetical protein